jgi:acetyl-CoA carboxylase biotin carboxyl carrier protein
MTFEQIQELIKLLDTTGIGEFKLNEGDQKIHIRTRAYVEAMQDSKLISTNMMSFAPSTLSLPPSLPPATPVSIESSALPAAKTDTPKPSATSDLLTIKSPMIGTFYRRPGPDRDMFVKIGDSINKGTVLCIIEAMKLYNEIEAEISGTIVKVLVDDGSSVEYDQPIFLVQP